jgi:cytoskeletal protein RodZ
MTDFDFGKRLEKARIDRGLSIEHAAAAVRIRSPFLRALEAGDLTKFPNAAYAKSFLLMYGRFLGVDLRSVAAEIDTTTQMKVEGYQYLTSRAEELPKAKPEPDLGFSMAPPPKTSSPVLPLLVLAGIVVVAVMAVTFLSNLNRLDETPSAAPAPRAAPGAEGGAVQPLPQTAQPLTPAPAPPATSEPDQPPAPAEPAEPPPPRPVVIAMPTGSVAPAPPATPPASPEPAGDGEIPKARPISPVAKIAASDTAALATLGTAKAAGTKPAAIAGPALIDGDGETTARDRDAIILEPKRKTWVVIRNRSGGEKLYEDYLDPTAKPMRLPAGRYFIELADASGVEISRNGKRIAYAAPGVTIE